MIEIPKHKKVILFDGYCNMCNSFVQRVIKHDKKNIFLFAAISSNTGKQIIDYLNIDTNKIDAVILYEPNVAYEVKSTAALSIMKEFGGLWYATQVLNIFPEAIRNYIYDYIAKNRYKWFGKKNNCMIPTPELKSKFLE
jgi:predicted DCC family thiol-disulfide oxidoreductase YuxK|tara:strand:+ start:44 stop:460 length:417 start_codon:yes stop_codon:yes gene_type:complete